MDFSTKLASLLEDKGISQKWLADAINSTEATVSRYVTGVHRPNAELIVSIAQALGVSTDYLLGLTPVHATHLDLSVDERILVACFRRANDDDRDVMWALLKKYMSINEKEYFVQSEADAN